MKRVIIVGGGASVNLGIDQGLWEKIKNETIWSLNYAFLAMPYLPKRELWVDKSFFKNNIEKLEALANKKVEMVAKNNAIISHLPGITTYPTTRNSNEYHGILGINKKLIFAGKQGFVGTFALHLAICEGYDEICLLGYDYGIPADSKSTTTHFYQNTLKVISSGVGRPSVYLDKNHQIKKEIADYNVFLQEKDVTIWNVSLTSNITCFPKISYEVFLQHLLENSLQKA